MTKIDRDLKWLLAIAVSVAIPVVGFQWKQSVDVARAMASVGDMRLSIDKLTSTVESLLREDVADLKARLLVMESKKILPQAVENFERMEERMRSLESKVNSLK